MQSTKCLLIVAQTPSHNTERMAKAILQGALQKETNDVEVLLLSPLEAQPEHVTKADAIILLTTENLGYMGGLMKDFFDRIYYPCLEKTQGLPSAIVIKAGNDGTGANSAIKTVLTGLKWKIVQEPIVCRGSFRQRFIDQCEELGQSMAVGLELGVL